MTGEPMAAAGRKAGRNGGIPACAGSGGLRYTGTVMGIPATSGRRRRAARMGAGRSGAGTAAGEAETRPSGTAGA